MSPWISASTERCAARRVFPVRFASSRARASLNVQLDVEPAGFTLEHVVEFPPFHYGAVFRVVEATKVGDEL